jgi:hypothetical protein
VRRIVGNASPLIVLAQVPRLRAKSRHSTALSQNFERQGSMHRAVGAS